MNAAPKGKYAGTVTVGAKGQIVIPGEVRKLFGIRPGDTLIVLADQDRGIAIPPKGTWEELSRQIFREGGRHE